jgi:hypothetical protein
MSQPNLDVAGYLQHAGQQCPVCQLEGVWRNLQNGRVHALQNVCVLLVPCHCTRCPDSHWVELYRLVGVDWDGATAMATAEKIYRSVDPHRP